VELLGTEMLFVCMLSLQTGLSGIAEIYISSSMFVKKDEPRDWRIFIYIYIYIFFSSNI
jgi:hypothetical protein